MCKKMITWHNNEECYKLVPKHWKVLWFFSLLEISITKVEISYLYTVWKANHCKCKRKRCFRKNSICFHKNDGHLYIKESRSDELILMQFTDVITYTLTHSRKGSYITSRFDIHHIFTHIIWWWQLLPNHVM